MGNISLTMNISWPSCTLYTTVTDGLLIILWLLSKKSVRNRIITVCADVNSASLGKMFSGFPYSTYKSRPRFWRFLRRSTSPSRMNLARSSTRKKKKKSTQFWAVLRAPRVQLSTECELAHCPFGITDWPECFNSVKKETFSAYMLS